MDRQEKNIRKAKLREYVDLGNGRFKDHEVEELEALVANRDDLNGTTKTYRSSYRTFDSEDTYRVEEKDTYTFCSDNKGIHIKQDFEKHWDDGKNDVEHKVYDTARDILRLMPKLFGKSGK